MLKKLPKSSTSSYCTVDRKDFQYADKQFRSWHAKLCDLDVTLQYEVHRNLEPSRSIERYFDISFLIFLGGGS